MITKYKLFENLDEELKDFTELCKPFINEIKDYFPQREEFQFLYRGFQFLYRGFKIPKNNTYIYKKQVDRKPVSTPDEYHYLFNKVFNYIFKWNVRSDGVFTTTQYHTAAGYGTPMLVFPIGDYRYVFSENVYDLYTHTEYLDEMIHDEIVYKYSIDDLQDEDIRNEVRYNVVEHYIDENYQDHDLMLAFDSGVEIVFDCTEYYLFPGSMKKQIIDIIYPE